MYLFKAPFLEADFREHPVCGDRRGPPIQVTTLPNPPSRNFESPVFCNCLYRGAFGAHVAGVLRRLLRVCLFYGRCPQFLCCSATIANPAEHMQRLIPLQALYREALDAGSGGCESYLAVIGADQDGSPQGERYALFCS